MDYRRLVANSRCSSRKGVHDNIVINGHVNKTFSHTSSPLLAHYGCKYPWCNMWSVFACEEKSSAIVKRKSRRSPKSSPNSKDQKIKSSFGLSYTLLSSLHHHPTLNFSNTSRGPTPKGYTFLETSHEPWLRSKLRCKNFAHFFATLFCKQTELTPNSIQTPYS